MKTNVKAVDKSARLAGGFGAIAAKQDAEALLRRAVMGCLLWEDLAYESGSSVASNIADLVPQVEPQKVAEIAVEARMVQKLRHVPLFIVREMARHKTHRQFVEYALSKVIRRADELSEFMALYWKDKKQPIAKSVKLGLAAAFAKFDEYALSKYDRDATVKLRDVLFMIHAKPKDEAQAALWKRLVNGELASPETWENRLSRGEDAKTVWTDMLYSGQLGALAFMRNLRNMEQARVEPRAIQHGFDTIDGRWLLPLNYYAAAQAAPRWERQIESMMLRSYEKLPKLPGYTVFVVDVSGSMAASISSKSEFRRLDAAKAMAMLAAERCERVAIYATAGSDTHREHRTRLVAPRRGFALGKEISDMAILLGGGGIFTRQCLEYIKANELEKPDRIIIFSDSQDCDRADRRVPKPFGVYNYIVDVSSHRHGINYDGVWTAEVSGWSEHFITFISALEGQEAPEQEQ